MVGGGGGEVRGRRRRRGEGGGEKEEERGRRRHFTQTVKTKYINTKQGCKRYVKQTWNTFN